MATSEDLLVKIHAKNVLSHKYFLKMKKCSIIMITIIMILIIIIIIIIDLQTTEFDKNWFKQPMSF